MNNYDRYDIGALLSGNPYPGRGIVAGMTPDGLHAAAVYFIMGRSENSRNRVFEKTADGRIITKAFDESKVQDPSLIIYTAVDQVDKNLIVTNGDQTDTICDHLKNGKCFNAALRTRTFEPDAPNFTPRISAMFTFADGSFSYKMSILKSADPEGSACNRFTFDFAPLPGEGRFIHTYDGDGAPLPSFTGEPEPVGIDNDIKSFAEKLWSNLNEQNKISLYVRYTALADGSTTEIIVNKNGGQYEVI